MTGSNDLERNNESPRERDFRLRDEGAETLLREEIQRIDATETRSREEREDLNRWLYGLMQTTYMARSNLDVFRNDMPNIHTMRPEYNPFTDETVTLPESHESYTMSGREKMMLFILLLEFKYEVYVVSSRELQEFYNWDLNIDETLIVSQFLERVFRINDDGNLELSALELLREFGEEKTKDLFGFWFDPEGNHWSHNFTGEGGNRIEDVFAGPIVEGEDPDGFFEDEYLPIIDGEHLTETEERRRLSFRNRRQSERREIGRRLRQLNDVWLEMTPNSNTEESDEENTTPTRIEIPREISAILPHGEILKNAIESEIISEILLLLLDNDDAKSENGLLLGTNPEIAQLLFLIGKTEDLNATAWIRNLRSEEMTLIMRNPIQDEESGQEVLTIIKFRMSEDSDFNYEITSTETIPIDESPESIEYLRLISAPISSSTELRNQLDTYKNQIRIAEGDPTSGSLARLTDQTITIEHQGEGNFVYEKDERGDFERDLATQLRRQIRDDGLLTSTSDLSPGEIERAYTETAENLAATILNYIDNQSEYRNEPEVEFTSIEFNKDGPTIHINLDQRAQENRTTRARRHEEVRRYQNRIDEQTERIRRIPVIGQIFEFFFDSEAIATYYATQQTPLNDISLFSIALTAFLIKSRVRRPRLDDIDIEALTDDSGSQSTQSASAETNSIEYTHINEITDWTSRATRSNPPDDINEILEENLEFDISCMIPQNHSLYLAEGTIIQAPNFRRLDFCTSPDGNPRDIVYLEEDPNSGHPIVPEGGVWINYRNMHYRSQVIAEGTKINGRIHLQELA